MPHRLNRLSASPQEIHTSAHYVVLNSYANADSMREVQRLMRHDETVVRYLTTKTGGKK